MKNKENKSKHNRKTSKTIVKDTGKINKDKKHVENN